MSQLNVELHEKYPYETIPSWEHDVVHTGMAAIGFQRIVDEDSRSVHLPRACYFNLTGSREDVGRVYLSLKNS